MIHIDNVSLQLNKRQILSNISLDLRPGKIYGLVGNNGCGKTMLMKCICGFVHPTGGQIQADGKVIGKDVDYLPDAGIIIETPGFIGYYSGMKNLQVLAGIRHGIDQKQIRETMEAVGLDQKGVQEIRRLLLSLRARDKIILIASHNAEDIEVLCDRVYEMDNRTLKQNRRRTCLKMNGKDRK